MLLFIDDKNRLKTMLKRPFLANLEFWSIVFALNSGGQNEEYFKGKIKVVCSGDMGII